MRGRDLKGAVSCAWTMILCGVVMQLLESLESGERRRGFDFERKVQREVLANGATEVCPRVRDEDALGDKAARVAEEEEAAEPLPLDKLAPEVLNIIAEALAADEDVLVPKGHLNQPRPLLQSDKGGGEGRKR